MKFIYDQLGDWYLSMAAYDGAPATFSAPCKKTGYADFGNSTAATISQRNKKLRPEILAAIIIANNPSSMASTM